jgi:hypothetical protein
MRGIRRSGIVAGCLMVCAVIGTPVQAQLLTQHVKGTVGLKGGSQPPPHVYVIAPLLYVYFTDQIKDRNGERLPIDASINSVVYGAGISVVTHKKFLGGSYGYQVLFPVGANNRIQGTEIDANPGAGITDSAIAPINLGWHFKRADAVAGYSIFVPIGRIPTARATTRGSACGGTSSRWGRPST